MNVFYTNWNKTKFVLTLGFAAVESFILITSSLLSSVIVIQALEQTTSASASQSKFTLWTDPGGRVKIEYPSGWLVQTKSMSQQTHATFYSPYIPSKAVKPSLSIDIGVKGNKAGKVLHGAVESALKAGLLQGTVLEGPSYTKYKVDGHEAVSLVYTSSSLPVTSLNVESFVNDTGITIAFNADSDIFNSLMPTVNKMIDSIRILKL
jgi:hypothetical protein